MKLYLWKLNENNINNIIINKQITKSTPINNNNNNQNKTRK